LQNVWWFETWKNIYPEYHTEENRYWHSHSAKANPPDTAAKNQRIFSSSSFSMRSLDSENIRYLMLWVKKLNK
jgi:hypothetical protein